MQPVYSVIIPAYNEQAVIGATYARLTRVMAGMDGTYELVFVNDGSRDNTAALIAGFCAADPCVRLVSFTRNFGHMPAITAGMAYARGAAVIVIDADLQDPPEVLPRMAALWRQGYDVVYGKRTQRRGESWFKRLSAKAFYRVLRGLTDVDIPTDTGEFRLIDRKVCDAVNRLHEKSRYIRGLVSWVGFKQTAVEYVREERFAGETKYPLRKMLSFAMDAITAFSHKPLKLATTLGFFISLLGFSYLIFIVFQHIFTDTTLAGWTSTVGIILSTQGMVLMILGLMGEYVGRIYDEVKNRPVYMVQEVIERDTETD